MFTPDIESQIKKNEALLTELLERSKELELKEESLFKELNVTPDQLVAFIATPDNFTQENWQKIQEQKSELGQKLARDLKNIKDPRKTKQTYSERVIDNRWLFVR